MIEVVDEARCTNCNICVEACPTTVFDRGERAPIIARIDDCQTCFMCELYCPVDAMFVHPFADRHVEVRENDLEERALLGGYSRALGWKKARAGGTGTDQTHRLFEIGVT